MQEQNGFVAGTLVYTDQGLMPIEQLKEGDLVLSRYNSGIDKIEYKPVVSILKSDNQYPLISPIPEVYCTNESSFWVEDKGWVSANKLGYKDSRR